MNKKIIVVIGQGRSGTSLIMQFLSSLNISTTTCQIDSNNNNPKGFWEDKEIVELEREFLEKKKPAHLPIPAEDFGNEDAFHLKTRIKEILLKSLEGSAHIFALKDPRISLLFPIWKKVFSECGIEPLYIFACRAPEAFIDSNKIILGDSITQEALEWEWYFRTVSSFYHTNSRIFIAHYEDWFTDPDKQASMLSEYIGIDSDIYIRNTIDPKLNRSGKTNITIANSCVSKAYGIIANLKGTDFTTREVQSTMERLWNDIWAHIYWLYPEFSWRNRRINILENNSEALSSEIQKRGKLIHQKNEEIKKLTHRHNEIIHQKKEEIKTLEQIINEIKSSKFWKARKCVQNIRNKFAP